MPLDERKQEALSAALAQIEKQYGKGSIMRFGSATRVATAGITTGSLSLDIALGGQGMPRGRIAEVFGPESSGKTTLCLHVVANAQKAGGVAAFIDAEHALDPAYAKRIGVDLDNLLLSQPDYGEQALEIAEHLVRSNAVDVIVIDSVAALVPKAELEGDMGDPQMGLQARLMSQALRKLTGAIARAQTCVIFTNQIREKIGVMFGNPETTPGGRALKFHASARVDTRKVGVLKEGEESIGIRCRATVVKNKVAPPYVRAEFDILYHGGISWEGDLLDLGVDRGVLDKSGTWLSWKGTRLGQGREKARDFLRENAEIAKGIEADIRRACGLPEVSLGAASAGPPGAGAPPQAAPPPAGGPRQPEKVRTK